MKTISYSNFNLSCFIKQKIAWLTFVFVGLASGPAMAVNWDSIEATPITLFYPGLSSWEWLLTANDHSGAKRIRIGKRCIQCHEGEESDMGNAMITASRSKLPILANKPATLDAQVKLSYDSDHFYVQISWKDGKTEGSAKMDKDYASRITVMLDDGHVTEADRAGCWGTCHDDAIDMPSADSAKEITKYLARSRTKITRSGGGENYKSTDELNDLIGQGIFMEYWQARLNLNTKAQAVDGYILDKRHRHNNPLVLVNAQLKDGIWTVEFSRKRQVNKPLHKDIVAGQHYTIGFAIHDDYANHRHHFVSFGRSFVLDEGDADFIVKTQ